MNIVDALYDPAVFSRFYPHLENGSWANWVAFLKSLYGLPLSENELEVFHNCTGRPAPFPSGYAEAFAICGRRSGKSSTAALIAAFEAQFGGWGERLGHGQKYWLFIIATDKQQAGNIFHIVKTLFSSFPESVERETTDELWLKNGACIGVKSPTYRSIRGFNVALAILDEMAFFRDDRSANPCDEILTSLLPSLLEGGRVLGISTPFAKYGTLYEIWKSSYGDSEAEQLVWKASTQIMNPSYKQSTIDKLLRRDRVLFTTEYLAEFREDLESFLPESLVRLYCTEQQVPPQHGMNYFAFIDPSGGRQDSYTLAIAHAWDERIHLDLVREATSPFDPAEITKEYAAILKHYGIYEVISDRFGGAWVESAYSKHNIRIKTSELSASDLYLEFQARLTSGQCALLDDEKLMLQLRQLERRAVAGGKDKVDHPQLQGFHDDLANAVAGVVCNVGKAQAEHWTADQLEARLPQINSQTIDMQDPRVRIRKEAYQDAEMEMRRFIDPTGKVGVLIRR